ncbi:fructokinase [Pelomonas saccharophila]|uniref:Fructokinase n=1 Tax=Roseateles saccharophilus TaxID=304 RepID=A0ABU1YU00_ROSSA|nr:PfkB family carbohydrate kinase [Roseateles saccharophilus]MDR7271685.1 fructokinase [Roseateles saccharophilus]
MPTSPVAVLGEALVDEFHDGPVAGGAPFNVARSLAALGAPALFISRIGADDDNGRLVLDSARRYGLDSTGVQRDLRRATGRVSVHEGAGGHHFEIHGDAAWDHIDAEAARPHLALARPAWMYFGSLAQRQPASRAALRVMLKPFRGTCFLDLNLRAGSETRLLAAESLMLADWVKVNDEELGQLAGWFDATAPDDAGRAAAVMARFALQRLVLTCGASGWRFYAPGGVLLAQGAGVVQPRMVDTVGAGDAFTALLLAGQALKRDLPATLALANRYASFICGVRGPLPADPIALQPWRTALHALPTSA